MQKSEIECWLCNGIAYLMSEVEIVIVLVEWGKMSIEKKVPALP